MGMNSGMTGSLYVHLTLVPYISPTSSEIKTKPTQHSVKELRSIGIQPDILVCRSEKPLPMEQRKKIALFTNVQEKSRHFGTRMTQTTCTRYRQMMHEQGLDEIVATDNCVWNCRLQILSEWERLSKPRKNPKGEVNVAMVGKYVDLKDCLYFAESKRCNMAASIRAPRVNIHYYRVAGYCGQWHRLPESDMDGIVVPGGFGDRGIEGKIETVQLRA